MYDPASAAAFSSAFTACAPNAATSAYFRSNSFKKASFASASSTLYIKYKNAINTINFATTANLSISIVLALALLAAGAAPVLLS